VTASPRVTLRVAHDVGPPAHFPSCAADSMCFFRVRGIVASDDAVWSPRVCSGGRAVHSTLRTPSLEPFYRNVARRARIVLDLVEGFIQPIALGLFGPEPVLGP